MNLYEQAMYDAFEDELIKISGSFDPESYDNFVKNLENKRKYHVA